MDKNSSSLKENKIFTPIALVNPNLYYNNLLNQNIVIQDQSPNKYQKKDANPPQPQTKNNSKNNTHIEISLISLLNAISDLKAKKMNSNTNTNSNNNNTNPNKNINSFSKKSTPSKIEKNGETDKNDKIDINDKSDKSDKIDKSDKNDKNDKIDKIDKNDSFSSDSEKQGDSYAVMELLTQKTKRNQKYCNACPHHNAPHYAKGMCSNCYHSRGRKKKPWKCPHLNKFHYAHGLCQNCYQMKYMKKQNDDGGIRVLQSSSNLDFEELSNNSFDDIKERSESVVKRGKSSSVRHSKKKLINN